VKIEVTQNEITEAIAQWCARKMGMNGKILAETVLSFDIEKYDPLTPGVGVSKIGKISVKATCEIKLLGDTPEVDRS
jgi:hypothetical protein